MFEARFQTFEDSGERGASAGRLAALRAELKRQGLDGFIVPRADRHQGEYVPPSDERLAWLTAFSGSAGAAIVLADRAVIFVDGRYQLQVRDQVDTALFSVEHLVENPPDKWLEANLPKGARFGYDPWLHTADGAEKLAKAASAAGASLVPADPNPVDAVWTERPAPPLGRVVVHDLKFAGEPAAEKLARVQAELAKLKSDALIVSDPHNVAWTFNIRGSDVGHTPLPLSFASVPREGRASVYIDGRKLSNEVRDYLETLADVREPAAFSDDLKALGKAKAAVRLDSATAADATRPIDAHHLRCGRYGDTRRRSDHRHESGEERDRNCRHPQGPDARRCGGCEFPCLVRPRGAKRKADRDRRRRGARNVPPRYGPAQGAVVPDDFRLRAERRDRALPGDARDQPGHRAGRAVPGGLRRAIRGRHDGHHPHDRGRHAYARDARALHPCAQGPYRDRARGVSGRHDRRAARTRSRANISGPRASTSITAPVTASAAICRCTRGPRAFPSSAPRRSSAA